MSMSMSMSERRGAGSSRSSEHGPSGPARSAEGGKAVAYESIRRDVLARIERRRLRADGDLDEVRLEATRAVDAYQRRAHVGDEMPLHEPREMVERVLRSITDFGPLTELVGRATVALC